VDPNVTSPALRLAGRTSGRLVAGDFERSVGPHYTPLVRRLVLVLGDEAEAQDIAQETYLQAYRSWSRFDGADVRAWLYTIGLRLAFNELRRRRRWLAALSRVRPKPWQDPADPDLAAALKSLEPRVRAALLFSLVDGYTHAEIATMFSVPEGTVASWISRARSHLRSELNER
jgi:RNA polymerase sigma-70 factor, ECF subfamily